jgi:1-acyl-sn-glycerol-3-phosphate acyltransferase
MGIGLSLYTAFEIARGSVAVTVDALTGRLRRDDVDRRIMRFARNVVRAADIRIDVLGAENVPSDRTFVFMSNHQSHLDIPILYWSLPVKTLRMVAKAELFRVPIWGRAMREGGMIEVDRSNRRQAIESLRRAGDALADGVSIFIAPEGTRSRTGELGPLKKGGFHLALETNTPIIPVTISGSFHILPPETIRMRRGVEVVVQIGEPIEVEGRDVESLRDEVEAFFRANITAP